MVLQLAILSASPYARRYPLSYVYSGLYDWNVGGMYGQDSNGYWWFTTASSSSNAYNLNMYSGGLTHQDNRNKAYGFALRSILRF
ncbi:hypothetical protein IJH16_01750 [Candidatus Saccharibacteria bacterium]|nr:hypothetical protein [Candidatus Saccharibacteria bacterium]